MILQSQNRLVACTPFEKRSVETVVNSGFATVKNKATLVPLTVIFGNDVYPHGSVVYVKGDQINAPWVKEVFELRGQAFVLVPHDQVKLADMPGPITVAGLPIR